MTNGRTPFLEDQLRTSRGREGEIVCIKETAKEDEKERAYFEDEAYIIRRQTVSKDTLNEEVENFQVHQYLESLGEVCSRYLQEFCL